ncbi:MAG: phospholipase, partial [Deltaproteobacteria bacterium]
MSGKDPRHLTRRNLLRSAAAGGVVSACRPGPRADDSGGGSSGQIDHIIMVMMENRSFDHW